jgi:serine/threonine protein kinase
MMHSWEIEASELAFSEEVGQGASAHVFKGKYRGQQVAIKVLKATVNPEEFKKEFEIMSEIRSPMVVFFYGAVTRPNLSIVTEFLSRGSLYDVMSSPVPSLHYSPSLSPMTILTLSCVCACACACACACRVCVCVSCVRR